MSAVFLGDVKNPPASSLAFLHSPVLDDGLAALLQEVERKRLGDGMEMHSCGLTPEVLDLAVLVLAPWILGCVDLDTVDDGEIVVESIAIGTLQAHAHRPGQAGGFHDSLEIEGLHGGQALGASQPLEVALYEVVDRILCPCG